MHFQESIIVYIDLPHDTFSHPLQNKGSFLPDVFTWVDLNTSAENDLNSCDTSKVSLDFLQEQFQIFFILVISSKLNQPFSGQTYRNWKTTGRNNDSRRYKCNYLPKNT